MGRSRRPIDRAKHHFRKHHNWEFRLWRRIVRVGWYDHGQPNDDPPVGDVDDSSNVDRNAATPPDGPINVIPTDERESPNDANDGFLDDLMQFHRENKKLRWFWNKREKE